MNRLYLFHYGADNSFLRAELAPYRHLGKTSGVLHPAKH